MNRLDVIKSNLAHIQAELGSNISSEQHRERVTSLAQSLVEAYEKSWEETFASLLAWPNHLSGNTNLNQSEEI